MIMLFFRFLLKEKKKHGKKIGKRFLPKDSFVVVFLFNVIP
jgi:hypothetical protein